jgi:Carboxypeptidase regulatory-like domain/TonB-dependent Receptor Plug Domain
MVHHWYKFLMFFALAALLSVQTGLAGNGKIKGSVKTEQGEALVGANVVLERTLYGAAVDAKGEFSILNVPPGTYNVKASGVGYTAKVVTGVFVGSDQIVTVDFVLPSETIGLGEIMVEAQRPVIDKSQTSSKTTLTSDDIQALPIKTVNDLVNTAPSVYRGFIRGGKQYETKTLVDGIDVTDQYYSIAADQTTTPYGLYNGVNRTDQSAKASSFDLNVSSVEEASVLTGGIGSDYSSATAGVIAYSLKEGRGSWTGRADVRLSQTGGLKHLGPNLYYDDSLYFAQRNKLLADTNSATRTTNNAWGRRFTYFPGKYSYGQKPEYDAEIALGGALSDNAGLYLTGGWSNSFGRLPGVHKRQLSTSAKLNFNPSSSVRFTALGLLEDRGRIFGWKNQSYVDDFRFFLEGVPQWDGYNALASLKMTHVLSANTFYEVQASLVSDNTRSGYVDGNNDGIIGFAEEGDFLQWADTSQANRYMANAGNSQFEKFFSPTPRNESLSEVGVTMSGASNWKVARPGIWYENFLQNTATFKADLTSQISENHTLRGGVQARIHDMSMVRRAGYIGGVFPTYQNYVQESWDVKPKEYAVYAQDKMEYAGLIINLGFRLDALDLASNDFANYFAPFATITDQFGGPIRVPVRGTTQTVYINGVPTQVTDPGAGEVAVKYFFSPRIGVSHPISDKAAMYFSFSRQQQSQPFSRIYTDYNDFGNPSLPVETRVNQNPIQSTNYDLGVQWSFAENYGLDINAYYKDIQNYSRIGVTITPNAPYRLYNLVTDFGYADARGIELTVRKSITPVTDFLSFGGRVSYSYSYIKQSNYTGGNVTSFATSAGDSARYQGQIPFANFGFYNTIEQNIPGGNSVLQNGYDRPHRVTFNLFLKFPADITLSSVGTFASGFYYSLTGATTNYDPRSRELAQGPWTKRVDLRLEKGFSIAQSAQVAVYVDVSNAFNWTNILTYYTSSNPNSQKAWEVYGDPTGGPTIGRAITAPPDNSLIYDVPREVYFGVNLTF